jgi:hypothetical protein
MTAGVAERQTKGLRRGWESVRRGFSSRSLLCSGRALESVLDRDLSMGGSGGQGQRKKQIPPLRYGMTSRGG